MRGYALVIFLYSVHVVAGYTSHKAKDFTEQYALAYLEVPNWVQMGHRNDSTVLNDRNTQSPRYPSSFNS